MQRLLILSAAMTLALDAAAANSGFREDKLKALDQAIEKAITQGNIPGAVVWVEAKGNVYQKAYGNRALKPRKEAMTTDTIFDLASLTKVLGTAPSIMRLVERGKLDLGQTVTSVLPEFKGNGKDVITI